MFCEKIKILTNQVRKKKAAVSKIKTNKFFINSLAKKFMFDQLENICIFCKKKKIWQKVNDDIKTGQK